MNKFIQFINRKRELEFLESQLKKPASFTVIYGRRRVGKSELLRKFLAKKKSIFLFATQEVEKELAESFSLEFAEHFGDETLRINPFAEFAQLMEYLKGKDIGGIVLAIDEFPYLVDANRAIPSIIQKYWDMHFRAKGLHIVLCGSSIGAMETEVLGSKSPLYGRRTGQWRVDPLPFGEFMKFFPESGMEKLVEFYSITGGIPLYILEFSEGKTAYENAKEAVATRGSLLYQESDIILKEELREPKTYFSLLKEMSRGKNTLNELSNALGAERTALGRYVDTLIELDLVEAEKPAAAKEKARNTRYVLRDNYFKFWFRFVYPFKKDLNSFIFEGFGKKFRKDFNAHVGRQFEGVCREAIRVQNPIGSADAGRWWGAYRENGERKECEIDVLSINKGKGQVLFGECKWKENADWEEILRKLKGKAGHFAWNLGKREEQYAIFAKSFSGRKCRERNVHLYGLEGLRKLFSK